MSKNSGFDLQLGTRTQQRPRTTPGDGQALRILVVTELAGESTFVPSRPYPLDFESLHALTGNIRPSITVPLDIGDTTTNAVLTFAELESFEPDSIAEQIEPVAKLLSLRRQLKQPARASAAASQVRQLLRMSSHSDKPSDSAPPPTASRASADNKGTDSDDFSRLLGGSTSTEVTASRSKARVDSLISSIVADDDGISEAADERLVLLVDEVCQDVLRQVLSHPPLRRLENAWHALQWLVTELGEEVETFVWPTDPLQLSTSNDPQRSDLYGAITSFDDGVEIRGFDLVLLDRFFETSADMADLAGLAAVAHACNTILLTATTPRLAGHKSVHDLTDTAARLPDGPAQEAWHTLRESHLAPHIGLALPRLLVRLPYGKKGGATSLNNFEELGPQPEHEAFAWINPAYGLALLLGQNFVMNGWSMMPDNELDLDDLPQAIYNDGSGDDIKPPAETYLDENTVQRLGQAGIMSFMSFRNRNAVRLAGFHSIAQPSTRLPGRWRG